MCDEKKEAKEVGDTRDRKRWSRRENKKSRPYQIGKVGFFYVELREISILQVLSRALGGEHSVLRRRVIDRVRLG